jgi:hypothetical protein
MGGKGKQRKTDLKKGVPFKMMFRHHMDPAYYDPKVNDKIFVPDVIDQGALTEEQKKIVESFPTKDRGLYDPKESKNGPGMVEEDPLEAAVKKMQLRKEHRVQQKAIKEKAKNSDRKVKFADEEEEEGSDVDSVDYFDEEDKEEEYNSEEEEEYDE